MKIIHVNFSGRGGAAIAMVRLHTALLKLGVDSEVWCARDIEGIPNSRLVKGRLGRVLDSCKNVFVQRLSRMLGYDGCGSYNVFWSSLVRHINAADADIVHLHWINAEMVRVEQLPKLKRSVVWTFHDMWPFCGAEHYTTDERYKTGYRKAGDGERQTENGGQTRSEAGATRRQRSGNSENGGQKAEDGGQQTENGDQKQDRHSPGNQHLFCEVAAKREPATANSRQKVDLDRWVYRRKQKHWQNLNVHIVCLSKWIGECIKQSQLFKEMPLTFIPNGLDTDIFRPMDCKNMIRKKYEIPLNKKVILFGALNPSDIRKGGDLMDSALERLANKEQYCLVVFGADTFESNHGIESIAVGRIRGDQALADLYNCADVMCVPSRQESFGQTASEPLACGVPVVAFDATGLKDIVDHKVNGYLAVPYSPKDFTWGINWVLNQDANQFRESARNKAVASYSDLAVAQNYMDVYKQAIMG